MVKKKRQRLMTDVYPEEPNYFELGGTPDTVDSIQDLQGTNGINTNWSMGQQQYDFSGMNQSSNPAWSMQIQQGGTPQGEYLDGLQTEYKRVNPFKYLAMSEPERRRQNELRQQYHLEQKQARQEAKLNPNTETKGGGNVNVGGIIGAAANNTITALTNPNMRTSEKVATALGAPALAKIWSPNMEAANNALNDAQSRINNATNRYITDSNDTQGAFSAIKENNQLNRIDLSGIKQPTLKDFIGKRFKNGLTATLQGAASGSVGGPWGALGGAVTGMLGSLFGGIGQKKRAKRAMAEYQDKMDYLQRFAGNFNSFQKLNQQQSNENLLSNGLQQQRIQDLSNIRAFGGNLDMSDLSPNLIDLQNKSLDNQKYKYINQLQPTGFIDGGKTPNPGFPRLACGGRIRRFDFGGSMSGMDLPTGMQYYENGGTHEENPNGGIQVGVDSQGTPNLTEEGEFRYGDNVFSDRITVDPNLLSEYNVTPATKHQNKKANKGKLSYADMAKKYANKNKELANDPVSKDTLDAYMNRLFQAQEAQKAQQAQENQLADYNSALKTPTQGNPMYGAMKYSGMGNANQGVNEGTDMGMGAMDNSELSNVNRSGNPMMAAYGGRLYERGGTIVTNAGAVMTKQPDGSWVDETGQIKIGPYEMMAALANGTAFEEGTDQYNQIVNPTATSNVDNNAYLPQSISVTAVTGNQPMIDANGNVVTINPETGITSNGYSVDPNYIDVNSDRGTFGLSQIGNDGLTYDIQYGKKVDAITGNPYLSNNTINPNWQLVSKLHYKTPYNTDGVMPDGTPAWLHSWDDNAKNMQGTYLGNNYPSGELNYLDRKLNGNFVGDFGNMIQETNPFNSYNPPSNNPTNNTNTASTSTNSNVTSNTTTNTNTSTGGSSMSETKSYSSVSKPAGKVPPENNTNTNNQEVQTPAASAGEGFSTPADTRAVSVDNTLQKQNAGYADYTKPQIPKLSEAGLYSQLGKGLIPNIHNWAGLTNYKFQPNYQPSNRMEALGKTGYVPRTADHSGMYRAADLYDINAANNASQAMNMAMLRNIVNNSNGNRGFVGAQGAALDYNGLMGVGQNYATMFDKNNASRIAAYQDNKQTEQFNVDANNNMYRDNQQAGIQAKNFEYQTLADANRERFQTRTLEDQINRAAAQNKADAMARMFDNQMNYLVDRGRENRIYNMQNQDPTKMYWYDTKNKEWNFKGDSGAYGKLHKAMGSDVKALDSDLLDRWNQHLQENGYANVNDDFISDLVAEQKRRNDNAAQTKAEEKAEKTKQARAKYDYFYNQLDDATRQLLVEGGYNLDRFNIDKDADETTIALATSGLQNAIDDVRKWNRDRLANAQTQAYGGKINTNKNNSYKLHRYTQI